MAEQEVTLMKGNEAIAHAAIRCGADGYFGYPITPQSEVIETLAELKPWETTGMVVLQAESEIASINMIYGGVPPTCFGLSSAELSLRWTTGSWWAEANSTRSTLNSKLRMTFSSTSSVW